VSRQSYVSGWVTQLIKRWSLLINSPCDFIPSIKGITSQHPHITAEPPQPPALRVLVERLMMPNAELQAELVEGFGAMRSGLMMVYVVLAVLFTSLL
jgi:hypothetical protein